MDVQVADTLVEMRHEQLVRSRGTRVSRPQGNRRAALRTARLRLAMWAFGPGVMAPRPTVRRRPVPATATHTAP